LFHHSTAGWGFTMNRRQFLRRSSAASIAAAITSQPILASAEAKARAALPKAKNLIFMVSDGLSAGALTMVERWSQRNQNASSHWYQLLQQPAHGLVRCMQDVASGNALVPDSAAAGSAWGCGKRVYNNAINFHADEAVGTPLYVRAKRKGYATGLVTTARITHATPASFVANVSHRREEAAIARQYLEREVDCLLGGGYNRFSDADGSENEILAAFLHAGYSLLRSHKELQAAVASGNSDTPLLGLFAQDHLPYAIDRTHNSRSDYAQMPNLPTMMAASLQQLSRAPNGFFLQVEAARVDHAAHANDPAGLLHEQLEFDRCIPLALEFIERNPDTLIVITTDHGCGGSQLNGIWPNYPDSDPAFDTLAGMNASFEFLFQQILQGAKPTELIKQHLALELPQSDDAVITAICQQEGAWYGMLSDVLQPHLYAQTAIGWTSQHHTAEAVDLLALGAGAESFPTFLKNTEVFHLLTQLFEV
jgi:alkaline phosphatase